MHIKIGTRPSPLALRQTSLFAQILTSSFKDISYEVLPIKTSGDKILNKPLYEIGGKALFLKELEIALESGMIDVAVHSLKDVPGRIDPKFLISSVHGREYPFDILISKKYKALSDLPKSAIIGTSSPRRIAILKSLRPDLKIVSIRGNIGSRIEKVLSSELDATILAEAGVRRLGIWNDEYCHKINEENFVPAIGQGVIATEILKDRKDLQEILLVISDNSFAREIEIERGFLAELSADCDSPVGAYISKKDGLYHGSFLYAENMDSPIKIIKKTFDSLDAVSGKDVAWEIFKL